MYFTCGSNWHELHWMSSARNWFQVASANRNFMNCHRNAKIMKGFTHKRKPLYGIIVDLDLAQSMCMFHAECKNTVPTTFIVRLPVPQVSGQWKQLLNKTINPPVYLIQSVHRSWQYLFMLTPTYHFQLHSLLIFSGEDGNEQLINRKCDAGRRTQCIVGMSSQGMFHKLTYKTITTRYKFLQKPHVYRVHAHILMKHGASVDIRRRHVKFHLRGRESCLKKWTCVWWCVCLRMPRYVVKLMMLSPMKPGKNSDTVTGNSVFHRVSHHLLSNRSE